MTATISTTSIFFENMSYVGPFKSSAGNFYVFTFQTSNDYIIEAWKASDPTSSWSLIDSDERTVGDRGYGQAWCQQVGDVIYIGLTEDDNDDRETEFDMSTDSFSGVYDQAVDPGTTAIIYLGTTYLYNASDSKLAISTDIKNVKGTKYEIVAADYWDGVDWIGNFEITHLDANFSWSSAVLGTNGHFHVFYVDQDSGVLYARTYDSVTDTLETAITVASNIAYGSTTACYPMGIFAAYDDSGTFRVRIPYIDSTSGKVNVAKLRENSSTYTIESDGTTESDVTSYAVFIDPTFYAAKCALVNDGTDLYLVYIDSSSQDIRMVENTGSGWENDQSILSATALDISATLYSRSGTKIGVVLDDNGTIKYEEISIGEGGIDITGAGNIVSAEAFGTARLDLKITTNGIVSAETFGNANVSIGGETQNITDTGAIASVEAFGTVQLDLNVFPSSIVGAEAFGTAQLDLNILINGIASMETLGTATISVSQDITDVGDIGTSEAFGNMTVTLPSRYAVVTWAEFQIPATTVQGVYPTGISTAEAFGTAQLDLNITAAGDIVSAETFGGATVTTGGETQNITDAGAIGSAEAFGTAQFDLNISVSGIASVEVFGSAKINLNIAIDGIASVEVFGAPVLDLIIYPDGIASAETFGTAIVFVEQFITDAGNVGTGEAFGSAQIDLNMLVAGIATAEGFGTPVLDLTIYPDGIVSAETFGTAQFDLNVAPSGVAGAETFGTPTVQVGAVTIYPDGITTVEAFGTAQLNLSVVGAGGIATFEAFGTAQLNLNVTANGIATAEAFGTLTLDLTIYINGIASGEAFGTATVTGGAVTLYPDGITSQEGFGAAQLDLNIAGAGDIITAEVFGAPQLSLNVSPSGITSLEVFGTPALDLKIHIDGIASVEAFGTLQLNLNISPSGIVSVEAFGTSVFDLTIYIDGIASAEGFGTPAITTGAVTLYPTGITSTEAFGTPLVTAPYPPQFARPDSDINLGSWTDQDGNTTDLYAAIDEETPSDADYVKDPVQATPDTLEEGLSDVTDPGIHTNHVVRYRYRKQGGTKTAQLKVYLMQSSTEIASWTHSDVPETWTTAQQTLTEVQAGNITDYTDLRFKFEVVEV
jgi:hypothetical protein